MMPKILVAAGDPVTRHVFNSTLRKWHYDVVLAENGLEAWEALQQEGAPPLAILDWIMPSMNGVDICREVRRREQSAYTYILLLTEKERKQEILTGMEFDADDYLNKPFNPQELQMRLRAGHRMLDLHRELLTARKALRSQSVRETLTGVWNRHAIMNALNEELERAKRERSAVGIILAALDHLARIDESYGYLTGDAVLRTIGECLRRSIRPYDSVGRYERDTFLLIAPGCNLSGVVTMAERLRLTIQTVNVPACEDHLSFTVSLGVGSTHVAPTLEPDVLMAMVESALERARQSGFNRVEIAASSDLNKDRALK